MTRPKPIRYDYNTWLVMRNDPALPKAVIERRRDSAGTDVYFVMAWALDPKDRVLMRVAPTLEKADDLVRYDVPATPDRYGGPPNGIHSAGTQPRPGQDGSAPPQPDAG